MAPGFPTIDGREETLIECHEEARPHVPFGLTVTNRSITYERPVSFRLVRTQRVAVPLEDVSQVVLFQHSPTIRYVLGGVLVAAAVAYVSLFLAGAMHHLEVHVLATLVVLSIACFVSARSGWVLEFRAGGRRHVIEQPTTANPATRERMTRALQRAAQLLADPSVRRLAMQAVLENEAAAQAPTDGPEDRRIPCSDPMCIGILGDGGRCGTCGRRGSA